MFENWNRFKLIEDFNFKTKIDFYHVEKLIGKGCFGKVYLAKSKITTKQVALKVINKKNISIGDSM